MVKQQRLSQRIVAVAEDYLGPSAQRFMERLARNHFGTTLDQLTADNLQELIQWTRVSAAMLTDDTDLVSEFMERLASLS